MRGMDSWRIGGRRIIMINGSGAGLNGGAGHAEKHLGRIRVKTEERVFLPPHLGMPTLEVA